MTFNPKIMSHRPYGVMLVHYDRPDGFIVTALVVWDYATLRPSLIRVTNPGTQEDVDDLEKAWIRVMMRR